MERKKIIYFAAGPPSEAAADLRRLGLIGKQDSLRIVVPAALTSQLESLTAVARDILWRYEPLTAPWLWLRLMIFLGLGRDVEIIVFSAHRRSRFLKLFAFSLRGRVSFSYGKEDSVSFSLARLLWVELKRVLAAQGPICVIGSASPDLLRPILSSVRARYPGIPLHGVLPVGLEGRVIEQFDSVLRVGRPGIAAYLRPLAQCVGRGRFRKVILPWTGEQFPRLKWLGWLLPLWSVEVYNENLDAFAGRNLWLLARHGIWRMRRRREQIRRALPVGVVGSASALYLRKMLPVVRTRYAGAQIRALLPESLEAPASGLFDSVVVLRRGFFSAWVQAWRFVRASKGFQCWIVPCTNEPYYRMKSLAFLLPLAHRQIYNELADGFAIREPRMLYQHICWRLRDHLSFQIVAGTPGRNWLLRLGHLPLYGVRLLAGVPLLWKARIRSASPSRARILPEPAKALPRVDVLVLGSGRDDHAISEAVPSAGSVRVMQVPNGSFSRDVNAAIESSDAEFICLLDPECRIVPPDWLHRLLESFDDRTAQVGPELVSPDGEMLLRGLLLENSGALVGNSDNAVRWHRLPECLEVDALPWICVLVRRQVLLEVGAFAEDSGTIRGRVDAEFCRRLAARGWRSLCNRSVTAIHPAITVFSRAASKEVTEEIQQ